jgi:hypothetical protein
MPSNPLTLLNLCQAIRQTPQDALLSIDRETLLATRRGLLALKAEIDNALHRLAFAEAAACRGLRVEVRREHESASESRRGRLTPRPSLLLAQQR